MELCLKGEGTHTEYTHTTAIGNYSNIDEFECITPFWMQHFSITLLVFCLTKLGAIGHMTSGFQIFHVVEMEENKQSSCSVLLLLTFHCVGVSHSMDGFLLKDYIESVH